MPSPAAAPTPGATQHPNGPQPLTPIVPSAGATVECTIIVKAAPERSRTYGNTVCTAAIMDDGRLVRIYPVEWAEYSRRQIGKYTRVRAALVPSDERARRPESHKLSASMEVVNTDLIKKSKTPWDKRMALIAWSVDPRGVKGLRDDQESERRSLAVVKVRELVDFRIAGTSADIHRAAESAQRLQQRFDGTPDKNSAELDQIEHAFRYRWRCYGACCNEADSFHDMTCEDWELFESFRSWKNRYRTEDELGQKLWQRFFKEMGDKDLHFVLGTTSNPQQQQAPMIIGLVYPPRAGGATLCRSLEAPAKVFRPTVALAPEERARRATAQTRRKGTAPLSDFVTSDDLQKSPGPQDAPKERPGGSP
jgi:hypothetical protein